LGDRLTDLFVAAVLNDGKLDAQTLERRVGLDMGRIDQQPPSADQPGLGALPQHRRGQLLKHRGSAKRLV